MAITRLDTAPPISQKLQSWLDQGGRQAASTLISVYQRHLSPHKGFACAHRVLHRGDSCSQYAKCLILDRGWGEAIPLIRQRFRDCREAYQILRGPVPLLATPMGQMMASMESPGRKGRNPTDPQEGEEGSPGSGSPGTWDCGSGLDCAGIGCDGLEAFSDCPVNCEIGSCESHSCDAGSCDLGGCDGGGCDFGSCG